MENIGKFVEINGYPKKGKCRQNCGDMGTLRKENIGKFVEIWCPKKEFFGGNIVGDMI
jgi:hypothetical protein